MYGDNPVNFNGDHVDKALQALDPAENTQWSKMWLIQGTVNLGNLVKLTCKICFAKSLK